ERLRYLRYITLQYDNADLAALVGEAYDPTLPSAPRLGFDDPRFVALARTFEAECAFDGPSDPLLGDSLSISLLSLLKGIEGAAPLPKARRGGLPARQLAAATDYLRAHLGERVDPGALASLTGLSAAHFHRAFKASTGLPPHAWLTE